MKILPFPRTIEIRDREKFIRTRLSQTVVIWPAQAIALVGYMCWPNDAAARGEALTMLKNWPDEGDRASVPPRLPRIQHEWLRVADIFNVYWDLVAGQHQARRGGPSISKAIEVVYENTESRGTSKASLWHFWETYKDVAHLVTAATVICAHARNTRRDEPFGLSEKSVLAISNDDVDAGPRALRCPGISAARLKQCFRCFYGANVGCRSEIGPGNIMAHTAGH
jgi:hypothetical protein